MKRFIAMLLVGGLVACAAERATEPVVPGQQIMGDLPTVVDGIDWDEATGFLALDVRALDGLFTAAQEGVPFAFEVSINLADAAGRTVDLHPEDTPLVLMKPLGASVEGLLAFKLSVPWDGTDGLGNAMTRPLTADYASWLVLHLSTGRERVVGTETTGRLVIE
jgi:hypothetical protein